MNKDQSVSPTVPNLEWLAKLSDDEYVRLKKRYAEFFKLSTGLLTNFMIKMVMVTSDDDNEIKDAILKQIINELASDTSLPAKARAALKEALDDSIE